MGSLGTLAASLKLDGASAMTSGLRSVGSAASGLTSVLSAVQGPLALLGVSFAAFKSVAGITEGLKGVFEAGRELQTLSRATGESVGNIKMLQGAFSAAGLEAGEVPNALRAMQRAIGGVNEEGQPTSATLQRLGVNIQALKGMTAVQQMQALSGAFAKLPDPASQGAAAMQVFAREGQSMLALFRDPEAMAGLGKGMSAQAAIFQRNSAMFARVAQDLQAIGGKVRGLFAGIAEGIGPVILPLLDKLKSIDLTPIGQQIGSIVRIVANAFKGGQIGELLGLSLKLGAMEGANVLWTVLRTEFSAAGAILLAEIRTAGQLLDEVTNTQNWEGIGHALISAGFTFESKMLEAGDYLQAGMDYAVASSLHLLKSGLSDPLSFFQSNWVKAIINPVGLLTDVLTKAAIGFGDAIAAALHGNLGGVKSTVGALANVAALANPATALTSAFAKSLSAGAGSGSDAPNFNSFLQKRLGENAADRGTLDSAAADQMNQAGAKLAPLASRYLQQLRQNFDDVTKAVQSGLSGGSLFDASKTKDQLIDLAKKLNAVGDAMNNAPGGKGGAGGLGTSSLGGMGKQMDADRLARIGGFIGGHGGPAADFHKRTAVATERMAKGIDKLVTGHLQTGHLQTGTLWQ